MTYEQLQMNGLPSAVSTEKTSPSSRRDSLANRTALQEKVGAIVTAVTCGERLQECSEKFSRLGLSVKILPVYLQGRISDTFEEFSMTLPRWGIASGGEFGELVMSERHIEENECFCWVGTPTACASKRSFRFKAGRTPNPAELAETFPTPLSSDAIRMRYSEESLRKVGMRRTHGEYKKAGCNLSEYVAVFPTPQATSWGCSGAMAKLKDLEAHGVITETERKGMQAGNGGKLNPTWVEWLMGFPLGWTDLDASETQ